MSACSDQIISEIEGANPEKSSTKSDEELTDKILEFSEFSRRAVSAILRQGHTKLSFSVLMQDFQAACAFKCRRRQFMIILLGGTSGCGKSTLSSLLASRFGLTTVLSTDQVRHLLRNFHTKIEYPALYTSSYNTLEVLSDNVHGMTEDEKVWTKVSLYSTTNNYR